jgi:Flp pilus assembly protein TadG
MASSAFLVRLIAPFCGLVLRRFVSDRSGATAVIFGLALIPIALATGAAVDYSRASATRTELQKALDAALLAGAIEAAKGTAATAIPPFVKNFFQANSAVKGSVKLTTRVDTVAGVVAGTAQFAVDTAFMKLAGIKTVSVSATSQALYSLGMSEIALALDTTGSMSGSKLQAAQQAANDLIDTLFTMPNAAQNLRVSLVPFTYYVNVGLQYRNASWIAGATDNSTTTTQCWNDYPNAQYLNPQRVSATCYADGTPYDCSYTSYGTVILGQPVQKCGPVTSGNYWHGCVGSRDYPRDLSDAVTISQPVPALLNYWCSAPLVRLTNGRATVKTQISSLTADGETYIAPGLLWAWRTLSPSPPFSDGAAYSKKVAKTIVLMTDGANTHSPNYPDHEGSDVAQADTLTKKTCDNVKAAGIRVMTVAFEVTNTTIKKILEGCASSASDYYDATDINGMRDAFKAIGAKLSAVRLAK